MFKHFLYLFLVIFALLGCKQKKGNPLPDAGKEVKFRYAKNIRMESFPHYIKVEMQNPWKQEAVLHTYYLVKDKAEDTPPDGTKVLVPVQRSVVFTTAHANLLEMLGTEKQIAGVADARYMLIPDIQKRILLPQTNADFVADCGNSMKPNIEKIISLKPGVVFVSPFENSGGYGRLDGTKIPLIECADYMEQSALGRAEWMKFYGLLFGRQKQADSLFSVVERNYLRLKQLARKSKQSRSVLPDKKVGAVWYVPGGQSSVGALYKDAAGKYAYAADGHSGSLSLPFEKIVEVFGQSDFWLITYNGKMTRQALLAEYPGYAALRPFKTGEIYGCRLDKTPYFEEVSWRPDWLLQDLIQLFHSDIRIAPMRYYHKLR